MFRILLSLITRNALPIILVSAIGFLFTTSVVSKQNTRKLLDEQRVKIENLKQQRDHNKLLYEKLETEFTNQQLRTAEISKLSQERYERSERWKEEALWRKNTMLKLEEIKDVPEFKIWATANYPAVLK